MIKPKQRRFTVPSYSFLNKENLQPSSMSPPESTESKGRSEVEKAKNKEQSFSTYRGVRNMKHKGDKHHQEGLRKSSSLHDLSSSEEKEISNLESSRFLSRSGDRLNITDSSDIYTDSARLLAGYNHPYVTQPPTSWKNPAVAKQQKIQSELSSGSGSASSHTNASTATSDGKSQRRGSFDDKVVPAKQPRTASERAKLHRERSASMKIFPSQHALPNLPKIGSGVGGSGIDRLLGRTETTAPGHPNVLTLPRRANMEDENETDENKMAKSTEMHVVSRSTPPPPSPTRQSTVPGSPTTKFEETIFPIPTIVTSELLVPVTPEPMMQETSGPTLQITPVPTLQVSPVPTLSVIPEPIHQLSPGPTLQVGPGSPLPMIPEPEPLVHVVFTPDSPEREQVRCRVGASHSGQGVHSRGTVKDLMYMKKGWLIKMGTSEKDWKKHWFVLTGNSLRYYKDAKAEETNVLDGRIDLSSCFEIAEVQIQRNYGFKIKTRNGEYILSAMTSGIRSNWMKAIRLCMDLQASNKTTTNGEGAPPRSNDDIHVDTASVSSLVTTGTEGSQQPVKKEYARNVRRHYSDVNPGNISKLLSIKGLDNTRGLSPPVSSQSSESSAISSKEASMEREIQPIQKQTPIDLGIIPKPRKFSPGQEHVWSGDGIPFRRFVEGSDSEVAPVSAPEVASKVTVSDRQHKDEEEKKRRAKSPSARIKDRTRAKSPKLHSPPPGPEKTQFSFRTSVPGERTEDDRMSVSSEDMDVTDGGGDIDNMHLDGDDKLTSTLSSTGEGMLVDILEHEVESLKERLEHTEKELVKSHDSNSDLKTKLQTVVRDKENLSQPQASIDSSFSNTAPLSQPPDNSQTNAMKRQLKDSKDTVQRQKNEIDGLKSKLDMSVSKLTGTEKALSEALRDVKQEKDKFLKVTTEYNRKVRTLEGQLKDVTAKMDKYHENSLIKDKENRKLDNDLKTHQQRLRDHEREILKLKAVEHEYRQMKEKLDETDRVMARYRMELTEKDKQLKKIEFEYDEQFEKIMDEFTKERDDTEQHIEDLKRQLMEAKQKNSNNESLSSNMATLLSDKDEIIAQLEEKVIESETKMVEISEEMNESEDLTKNMKLFQDERDNATAKLREVEKMMSHYQNQLTRMEKENASIRKHMEDLRHENTDLSERLDDEKTDKSSLAKDKDELQSNIKDLEDEVHILHKQLTGLVSSHDRLSSSSDGTSSQEMLHTFILATSEINGISDCVLSMRKKVENGLTSLKGDQKSLLTGVAETLEDLGRKCENISEVLKEGSSVSVESEAVVDKSNTIESSNAEVELLKAKNKQSEAELEKLRKEITTTRAEYEKLQSEDVSLNEKVKSIDEKYRKSVEELGQRVEDLSIKHKIVSDKNNVDGSSMLLRSRDSAVSISSVIEGQLSELEDHIDMVEKVLQNQDLSMSSIDSEVNNDTAVEESESESEDSEDYLNSDEEEEELDEDTQDESTSADGPENLLRKLRKMKRQLEVTNSRIKGLTSGITAESSVSTVQADDGVELELRNTLIRCGEKIDTLANRLSDGLKSARTEVPRFSDQTWAFQKCVNQVKEKLNAVNIMVHQHDEINAKDLKQIQERFRYIVEYVNQVDKLGDTDWDIAGKIAKQEMKFQHLLSHREAATRMSSFKYEDKLQLYAEKLAFEAMILEQMAILIQRQQIGGMYKDTLLREIHEANLQIIELERRIDNTQHEMNPSVQEKDSVSSYASVLAEKIVLEGQLASYATHDIESSEHAEVLSALNVSDSPTVLAMEIFLRSQVDSSVNEQLQKFAESTDSVSDHIVTRALLQGEITHALQIVKQKFKHSDQKEDLSSLVMRERQFAFDQLVSRHKIIIDLLNETEPLAMTTLIQLIEFTQGPSSPTLDSVCDNIATMLEKQIMEYENSLKTADAQTKSKIEHIIRHLHTELEDAISIFREEYQCYVQTASPDIDTNVLKFSADSVSSDLAKMFIQKAVIEGTFTYVSELHRSSPEVSASLVMDPLQAASGGMSDLAKTLGQILLTEAANKQSLAGDIRQGATGSNGEGGIATSITDLIGVIPDLEAYPQSFSAYAATLVREAMFQSQLTYTTYKLQLEYHRKLRDIKLKMEAGEKVVLPSEISQEAESDIQASLTIFEDILETKYQDECAVLSLLETEISKLKSTSSEKSCTKCKSYESNIKQLENSFQHEVSVAQERQNVHIDVLRQEVNNVILRVDKFLEDYEKGKESLVNDYEDRIVTLQDEFDIMRIGHEEELEQVKQDIMTAVSAIKATEEEADSTSSDQLRNHNNQLMKMSSMCKELLSEVRANVNTVDKQAKLVEKIDEYMANMQQIEADPAFVLATPSTPPPLEITPTTPTIQAEAPPLDRSLSAERSDESVDRLLEKSHHVQEMEQLKKEKEEALADEVKTTKAALDAMRKAYEEELEQEKDKYRGAIKTMFTDNYVEDIRRRHDIESERLREELKQVSMHYESKGEDYKLLEDRLQRTKADFQTHINQLSRSNEQLNELVNTEIESLKQFITTRTKGSVTGSSTLEEELYDAQIMVRVKDTELQKLRSQVKNIENNLERTTEEQRYTMTQYLQCLKKNQELQAKFKQELTQQRERKDSSHEEQIYKNARALRRNPSFHQRARSPSPDTSPRKEGDHHSRDAHRRSNRHLTAKDLKRSKSSPSLPFVFLSTGSSPMSSSRNGQPMAITVSRRDSGKLARSQRK